MSGVQIRAFDGSLRDARGIVAVDRATFADCSYTAEHIVALESGVDQYAWVAEEEGQILGFVSAFATHSLAARRWEVDELAVHPAAQGRGVGAALVARAVREGMRQPDLVEARALVAIANGASRRVFVKNGFSPGATVDLLLYRVTGRMPRPQRAEAPLVRRATSCDAGAIAGLLGSDVARVVTCMAGLDSLWLVAEQERTVLGCAELIHVRTLQYEGFWIESLAAAHQPDMPVALALFGAAIEEAKCRDTVDEVGYLGSLETTKPNGVVLGAKVPCAMSSAHALYAAAVGEGMNKVDEYLVFTRELP
jgi:N-acetylglutamate synthase-like GNAT family acetyltransferase